MTITLELPDETVAALIERAREQGTTAEGLAIDTLTDTFGGGSPEFPPLGKPSDYPSEAAFVAEAVRRAQALGIDADTIAGIAEGIADVEAGRDMTIEEARARSDEALAEWRRGREAAGGR